MEVVTEMDTSPKYATCRNSGVSVSRDADSTREKNLLEHVLRQNLLEHTLEQTLLEHVLEQILLEHVLEQILLEHEHVLEQNPITLLPRTQKLHSRRRGSCV